MLNRLRLFGLVSLVTGAACAGAALGLAGPGGLGERAHRLVYFGGPLFRVLRPGAAPELGVGAIEVHIGFSPAGRVAADTFRCLLNGDDVTDTLTLGRNGAHGELRGLTEGPNLIQLQLFGRSWWGSRYVQDEHRIVVRVRGSGGLDRA